MTRLDEIAIRRQMECKQNLFTWMIIIVTDLLINDSSTDNSIKIGILNRAETSE